MKSLIESLRAQPSEEAAQLLKETLGVDEVLATAVAIDGGLLTLVGQRLAPGCAGAVHTAKVTGSLDAGAAELVGRLRRPRPSDENDRCAPPSAPSTYASGATGPQKTLVISNRGERAPSRKRSDPAHYRSAVSIIVR